VRVLRVGFVGVRTANVEATASFFHEVLDLRMMQDDPNWSILQLPTGPFDLFEFYGPSFNDERLAPPEEGAFIGFMVDDLDGAHHEVRAAGVEVSEIVWAAAAFDNPDLEGVGWFFLRAPDDNVYVIQHVPE